MFFQANVFENPVCKMVAIFSYLNVLRCYLDSSGE